MKGAPVRELVTTLLDLIGLVAVVTGLALYVARFGLPYAVATFGVGLLLVSLLVGLREPKPAPVEELD